MSSGKKQASKPARTDWPRKKRKARPLWWRLAHPSFFSRRSAATRSSREYLLRFDLLDSSDNSTFQDILDHLPQGGAAPPALLVAPSGPRQNIMQAPQDTCNSLSRPPTELWQAWTRSFNTPLLALLDLFDNAVDASLNVFDQGRPPQATDDSGPNGRL
jgi:hypothetical protein